MEQLKVSLKRINLTKKELKKGYEKMAKAAKKYWFDT